MNPSFRRSLALATLCLLAGTVASAAPAAKPAAAVPKNVDRFVRTKARIDALLAQRVKSEPLPAILPNPFLITGSAPAASGSPGPGLMPPPGGQPAVSPVQAPVETAPLTDDAEILAHYAGALKIGGIVEFNGRVQLMIDQTPRKEGDIIVIREKDDIFYLQVLHLTTKELTLGYKDTVQVIPLKGS